MRFFVIPGKLTDSLSGYVEYEEIYRELAKVVVSDAFKFRPLVIRGCLGGV